MRRSNPARTLSLALTLAASAALAAAQVASPHAGPAPAAGPLSRPTSTLAPALADACDSPSVLCLVSDRFQVTVNWTKPDGTTGTGTRVTLTDESGYFWFFDPSNIEMVVKVLNGCAINDAFWVFAAGLTNVQVDWLVTDTLTGETYVGTNVQGTPFAPVQATKAFPGACP